MHFAQVWIPKEEIEDLFGLTKRQCCKTWQTMAKYVRDSNDPDSNGSNLLEMGTGLGMQY